MLILRDFLVLEWPEKECLFGDVKKASSQYNFPQNLLLKSGTKLFQSIIIILMVFFLYAHYEKLIGIYFFFRRCQFYRGVDS